MPATMEMQANVVNGNVARAVTATLVISGLISVSEYRSASRSDFSYVRLDLVCVKFAPTPSSFPDVANEDTCEEIKDGTQ